jgi:hypothetical protein
MERTVVHSDSKGALSVALESRDTRAVEHLLAHCAILSAAQEPEPRRPVFERLRELLGGDLTSLLLFGLTRAQRPRPPLEGRDASAP